MIRRARWLTRSTSTCLRTGCTPTFNALDLELASRGRDGQGENAEGFRLRIANAVWGQHDYEFQTMFIDLLAENYGAGVRPANFREAPEESRVTINDWIAEQTEDRIMDLIPNGVINPLHEDGANERHLLQCGLGLPLR